MTVIKLFFILQGKNVVLHVQKREKNAAVVIVQCLMIVTLKNV